MCKLLLAALAALPLAALTATPKAPTLEVQNMTCRLCPITIKQSLQEVSGVKSVQVDFDQALSEALIEATTNAGYPSTVQESSRDEDLRP
ncbi:MAG: cation transporter [Pseudomonas sp.]